MSSISIKQPRSGSFMRHESRSDLVCILIYELCILIVECLDVT